MSAELDVLQVVRAYRDSPAVNDRNKVAEMADVAVSIVEITEAVKSNGEAFFNISRIACEIVANVIRRSCITEHPTFTDTKMEALHVNLRDIRDKIKKHIQRRGLMKLRIFRNFFSGVGTIRVCHNRLHNCYDILELQYIEETMDNVKVLTRHIQELLKRQAQGYPAQVSIAPNMSLDSSIGDLGPATEEERSMGVREGDLNHQAIDTAGTSPSMLPDEGSSLIRRNQVDTGGNSVSYAQIAGNAVSSSMGTVINVRGSGNRFRITLRA